MCIYEFFDNNAMLFCPSAKMKMRQRFDMHSNVNDAKCTVWCTANAISNKKKIDSMVCSQ